MLNCNYDLKFDEDECKVEKEDELATKIGFHELYTPERQNFYRQHIQSMLDEKHQ